MRQTREGDNFGAICLSKFVYVHIFWKDSLTEDSIYILWSKRRILIIYLSKYHVPCGRRRPWISTTFCPYRFLSDSGPLYSDNIYSDIRCNCYWLKMK